jgi:two-component system nitrogen regulation response regulator GlnG
MVEKSQANKRVFLVIAQGALREQMMLAYGEAGYEVVSAPNMERARPLAGGDFSLILADSQLPDGEGVELLARAFDTPVYFRCEDPAERLRLKSAGAAGFTHAERPLPCLGMEAVLANEKLGISGDSDAVRQLREQVRRVAASDGRLLLYGPTGSGKEAVIKALHALGERRHGPLVTVNAAAVPAGLIDSELFGHKAGAFTDATSDRVGRFVEADGGILVLDQVCDLPLSQQARLLRVLETGIVLPLGGEPFSVDVRIVATSHEPLELKVEQGSFRADLYHRLAVHLIEVPGLADRLDDMDALIADLAPAFAGNKALSRRLRLQDWPGNVRQLMHFLERLHLLRRPGEALMPLVEAELQRRPGASTGTGPWLALPLSELVNRRVAASLPKDEELPEELYKEVLAEMERGLFSLVLERVGGKQLRAAKHLGINRNTLHKKLKSLGMLGK